MVSRLIRCPSAPAVHGGLGTPGAPFATDVSARIVVQVTATIAGPTPITAFFTRSIMGGLRTTGRITLKRDAKRDVKHGERRGATGDVKRGARRDARSGVKEGVSAKTNGSVGTNGMNAGNFAKMTLCVS